MASYCLRFSFSSSPFFSPRFSAGLAASGFGAGAFCTSGGGPFGVSGGRGTLTAGCGALTGGCGAFCASGGRPCSASGDFVPFCASDGCGPPGAAACCLGGATAGCAGLTTLTARASAGAAGFTAASAAASSGLPGFAASAGCFAANGIGAGGGGSFATTGRACASAGGLRPGGAAPCTLVCTGATAATGVAGASRPRLSTPGLRLSRRAAIARTRSPARR